MSDTPFIKFFPSDFLAGTSGLSPAERGIYITILCLIWDGDGPVEMDIARLARRCGVSKASFGKILESLLAEEKLVQTPRGLTNQRAEKTILDRQNRIKKATHAATQRWDAQTRKNEEKQRSDDAIAVPQQCVADAKPEARSQIREGSYEPLSKQSSDGAVNSDEVSAALIAWNTAAARNGWPQVQKFSPNRRKALKARLREAIGLSGWHDALTKAEQSDFLCGRTDKPWTAFAFDWLVVPKNFTKLMEGNYDNRVGHPGGGGHPLSPGTTTISHAQSERIADYARLRAARCATGGGD